MNKTVGFKVAIGTWEVPPAVGGPATYITEIVKGLTKYIDVVLLVPSYACIDERDHLIVSKIGSIDIPIVRVSLFSLRASLAVKRLGVDLVHDNGVLGFSNFSPFVETWHHSNKQDKKYVSATSYYLSSYRERLTLRGIKKANAVIAISSAAKDELIQTYSIPSSKIFVTNHGVDVDYFKPNHRNQVHYSNFLDGTTNLLYVGSLSRRKNIDALIFAVSFLSKKGYNLRLILAGDGPQKGDLTALVNSLGIPDRVTFLGSILKEHLLELYNTADFVVLPSFKEGFGMTMLEALACEKPVIMTPVGISDIIKRNNLGIVTCGFTSQSIASAIEAAIDSKFHNLRMFVAQNFSWSKTIEATLAVYRNLAN